MKKVLSAVLALVFVLSMMPMTAFAADAAATLYTDTEATTLVAGDTFEYTVSISVDTSYVGYQVTIANNINGLQITNVKGANGAAADNEGDYWVIRLAPEEYESTPKIKIATVTATVGNDAEGAIELGFVKDQTYVSDWVEDIAHSEELASVTVVVPVTGVTLDKTTADISVGDTLTLAATVAPENATDKAVTWTTSDSSVATVENGVVTAKKVGTAKITAAAAGFKAECTVNVMEKIVEVAGVTLDKTEATLTEGDTLTLAATVTPDDATNKTVTWATSDADVATVENGVVTAVKAGTATITATAGDKSASCVITVKAPVLTFKVSSARAVVGKTVKVNVSVENNPGIAGMVLKFDYNRDVMTLVDYETGADFGATTNFDDPNPAPEEDGLFFAWVKDSNYTANGTILTLIFEVNETAENGDYDVTISCPDDVVTNEELEVLGYETVSGKISVVDVELGDAYSDGEIDVKDAIAIAQYLAQWTEIENFDEVAADCYTDGVVDVKDAVLLAQVLAGWQDVAFGEQN